MLYHQTWSIYKGAYCCMSTCMLGAYTWGGQSDFKVVSLPQLTPPTPTPLVGTAPSDKTITPKIEALSLFYQQLSKERTSKNLTMRIMNHNYRGKYFYINKGTRAHSPCQVSVQKISLHSLTGFSEGFISFDYF